MASTGVLQFTDPAGADIFLRVFDGSMLLGLVQASIRPDQSDCMATLARKLDIPLLVQPNKKSAEYAQFAQAVGELQPDVILVNSYAMILQPDILQIPKRGAVNVHGALLPQYRGANPIEWGLINECRQQGVTIHKIDDGVDCGPIYGQSLVDVRYEDTWIDVRAHINDATELLFRNQLDGILAGHAPARQQDENLAHHWRRRTAADGAFSWTLPCRDIYNLVRALVAPHPGAQPDDGGPVIDTFKSVAEIAHAKFRATNRPWRASGLCLEPLPGGGTDRARANSRVAFRWVDEGGAAKAHGALDLIDWYAGTCELTVEDGVTDQGALRAATLDFAHRECKLTVLSADKLS
jgi:methionyl-tRNA formyltransferase